MLFIIILAIFKLFIVLCRISSFDTLEYFYYCYVGLGGKGKDIKMNIIWLIIEKGSTCSHVLHTRAYFNKGCGTRDRCRTPTRSMVRCDRRARGPIPDYQVLLPVTHQPFIIPHYFLLFFLRKTKLGGQYLNIWFKQINYSIAFSTPSSLKLL